MPYIKYADIKIRKSGLALISEINSIISDYHTQGYSLTLRQVYYQLVTRNTIENSERSYNNLGVLINNGRLCGLIDWEAIEDRTRFVRALPHWSRPQDIIMSAAESYHIDLWADQPCYVEVWVEKDALISIVEQTCQQYDVPCFSSRGYPSSSELWNAAQRFLAKPKKERVLLHLGDHDPSGIDITRDITDRMTDIFGVTVDVKRIALNMPQVEQYSPPPNPAKTTDTRHKEYVSNYGPYSWELDALEPAVLSNLIRDNILGYLDVAIFNAAVERQEQERQQISEILMEGGDEE